MEERERAEAESLVRRSAVPLDHDVFLRSLMRELAGALESVIGEHETNGFISLVGERIGEQIDADYRRAIQVSKLSRPQVTAVLVDLKRRIHGDFYVIEETPLKIVLGNRACPFGDKVADRPTLCMMTSNVFGRITADNLGYAKVELQETIARGHSSCRIVVHVAPTPEAEKATGREYLAATA